MSSSSVAVVDYGMGNLHSVAKALEHVGNGQRVQVTSRPADLLDADRVVFPGVGAIRDCMAELARLGLDATLRDIAGRKPLLAICVGMQALLRRSEENDGIDCLGLFEGEVRRFADGVVLDGERLKVPHMGWNEVVQTRSHPLWAGIENRSRFYFVHSYYVDPTRAADMVGRCDYGIPFAAALAGERLFAVQFHPEKSDRNGLQLLRNFLDWDGSC
jgi:glutamine amidotransferase